MKKKSEKTLTEDHQEMIYLELIRENKGLKRVIDELIHHKKLGFTPQSDSRFTKGQLLQFADYCMSSNSGNLPHDGWSIDYLKQIHANTRVQQITIGASLAIAEINRRILAGIDLINDKCKNCELFDRCPSESVREAIEKKCKLIIPKFEENE